MLFEEGIVDFVFSGNAIDPRKDFFSSPEIFYPHNPKK
jgi:hypothetical protein